MRKHLTSKKFLFMTWFFVDEERSFCLLSKFTFIQQVKKKKSLFSNAKLAHLVTFPIARSPNYVNYIVSLYLRTSFRFKSNVLQISEIAVLLRPSPSIPRWISSSSSFDGCNTWWSKNTKISIKYENTNKKYAKFAVYQYGSSVPVSRNF